MRQSIRIATIIAAAGLCAPALAQDSVSSAGGDLPGDALSPWSQDCTSYVLDLSPIISTQGHAFGVGPVLKTQTFDSDFFNSLPSTSSISPDVLLDVPFTSATYALWTTPGGGIHVKANNFESDVSPTGNSTQFAVVQGSLGGAAGNNFNGVVGARINFDPANANRLYIDRNHVAVNRPDVPTPPSSIMGGYSIDANGNTYYRSEIAFNSNWYRTRMADRDCNVSNLITANTADHDATDLLVVNQNSLHPAPNMIPASIAGGNGIVGGINFSGDYVYGGAAPMSTDNGYVDNTVAGSTRGKLSSTGFDILNAGAGHAQTYGQLAKGPGGRTTTFNLHAVDASGARLAKKAFEMPLTTDITDNDDGFIINYGASSPQFYNYTGAATFQGVGHIALGHDQNDMGLMAATVMQNGTDNDFSNQILVARYDEAAGTTEWTFAAYVNQFAIGTPNHGKAIFDADGLQIGQLVDLLQLTGGSPLGPFMSAPAMDSVGNIWFMGAVELFDRLAPGVSDFDGALLRAIYDPATFSYRLEMVLETGQQIDGFNSGRKYRINFLGTSANNGTAAPAAMWTSNVAENAWNDTDVSGVDPSDPITNGGLVLSTGITYDTNDDGVFNDPTSVTFDPLFPKDEAYSVLMYIGYFQTAPVDPCPAPPDYQDDNVLNIFDVLGFLDAFNAGDPSADITGEGSFNIFDVLAFLDLFNAGCP